MRNPDKIFTVEEVLETGTSINTEKDKWGTMQQFLMTVDNINYLTQWLSFHHYEGCQNDRDEEINGWIAHQVMVPVWKIKPDEVQNNA